MQGSNGGGGYYVMQQERHSVCILDVDFGTCSPIWIPYKTLHMHTSCKYSVVPANCYRRTRISMASENVVHAGNTEFELINIIIYSMYKTSYI